HRQDGGRRLNTVAWQLIQRDRGRASGAASARPVRFCRQQSGGDGVFCRLDVAVPAARLQSTLRAQLLIGTEVKVLSSLPSAAVERHQRGGPQLCVSNSSPA